MKKNYYWLNKNNKIHDDIFFIKRKTISLQYLLKNILADKLISINIYQEIKTKYQKIVFNIHPIEIIAKECSDLTSLNENNLTEILAKYSKKKFICQEKKYDFDPKWSEFFPFHFVNYWQIFPLIQENNKFIVAHCQPFDLQWKKNIEKNSLNTNNRCFIIS